ncbi:type II toxin-antitoxin system RelE family toxin [Argonema galeatum]|uniref:type II toxin-antitoxin system RelE family toxin n=1 Tax=Argonema galeatum TaxID=2942762 RepID=UPI0020125169|nr:type II toxin-antitoxin system RelE/ParE family toxin [Argonema galeatum]MCL1467375.1 type II toxin-antitoxin system RelE/ParE family toxin [Argonema galeatum A003/A1]
MTFKVEFHPKAEKEAKEMLTINSEVAPQFRKYLETLGEEPYKFPKKKVKLKSCRALNFQGKGNAWRLIFRIIESRDTVEILAIGIHDDAYSSAERRV